NLDTGARYVCSSADAMLTKDGTGACSTVHLPISGLGAGEPTSIASGDFNEDGHADLVVGNQYSDNFALLLGNGDGTFGAPTLVPVANYAFTVAVGDVNEDGHLDVASGSRHRDDIAIHFGNGDGTFTAPVTFDMNSSVFDVHLTDLDDDDHLDIVVAQAGSIRVRLGDGAGGFGPADATNPGSPASLLAIGDLDGDGDLDVASTSVLGDNLTVLANDGAGGLSPIAVLASGDTPSGVAAIDADGDGDLDLGVSHAGSPDSLRVYFNDGTGTFASSVTATTGGDPTDLVAGDLDGDGDADFVTVNEQTSNISVIKSALVIPDTTAPTVSIAMPADGAVFGLEEVVLADYSCTDEVEPSPTCNGTVSLGAALDTSTVGAHAFSVTSTDASGNSVTVTHDYTVTYGFTGFAAPILDLNDVKAGQSVPVKWNLTDASGAPISDPSSFESLTSRPVGCEQAPGDDVVEPAAGASGLQYLDLGDWQYNWKTSKSYAGTCREMVLTLADGTTHRAVFQFR